MKVFDVVLNGDLTVNSDLDIFEKVGRGVAHDEYVEFSLESNKIIYQVMITETIMMMIIMMIMMIMETMMIMMMMETMMIMIIMIIRARRARSARARSGWSSSRATGTTPRSTPW